MAAWTHHHGAAGSWARCVARIAAVAIGVCALTASRAIAEPAGDALQLRIFLMDGAALASFGEFARVGDRVVFSMPLGASTVEPRLHVVNIPAASVDWDRTNRYAAGARAARYSALRGEDDFAIVSADVARVLNEIYLTKDQKKRLDIAIAARRTLAEWPAAHHNYRAADVRQMVGLIDEAISELRAAAGLGSFDLQFVATTDATPVEALAPPPTPAESIEQALVAARLTDAPVERTSLLRSILAYMSEVAAVLPSAWEASVRRLVSTTLAEEERLDKLYAQLTRTTIAAAATSAARADVRGVEAALKGARERDARLGRRRPDAMQAIATSVGAHLDSARRLRLVHDLWTARAGALRDYERRVKAPLATLASARSRLEDIQALAGPTVAALSRLERSAELAVRHLARVTPPIDCQPIHALLTSAASLTANAAARRRQAVASGSLQEAWDASSAAAGALMLLGRAREELAVRRSPPKLE